MVCFYIVFFVNAWPISLIKIVDRCIQNFIWSGDINVKKVVTVTWNKVFSPITECGLGIRSLRAVSNVDMLKLCWDFIASKDQ